MNYGMNRRALLKEWREAGLTGARDAYQLGAQLAAQEEQNRQLLKYVSNLTPLGAMAVRRYEQGIRGGEFPR